MLVNVKSTIACVNYSDRQNKIALQTLHLVYKSRVFLHIGKVIIGLFLLLDEHFFHTRGVILCFYMSNFVAMDMSDLAYKMINLAPHRLSNRNKIVSR